MERPNAWKKYEEAELKELHSVGEDYKDLLSTCKTEREWAKAVVARLEAKGYRNLEKVISENGTLQPGDRVYACQMGKAVLSFHLGREKLEQGMNIVGAHIDSPRLDLKQN
ncbi:MAG: aminopeptidase, partial [Clostridia bacterium]|nr:aminopeptidase [Clostridia bacterium]